MLSFTTFTKYEANNKNNLKFVYDSSDKNFGSKISPPSKTHRSVKLKLYFDLGWLEPLLDRIARNTTTVVCPVIDVIDDTTMEYHWRDSGGVNVGGFDWSLQFNWHAVPERERKRHKVYYTMF